MNRPPDPTPRPLQVLLVVLVALTAFSYGFVPERADNDVWWHLKAGKLISDAGGRPPLNDPFTFTGEDVPWYNHEWLAQCLFYKIFALGGGAVANLTGLRALILFKSLILAATFLLVLLMAQQRCRCMPIAALITLLALDVSRYTLYPRPPILTYLFMAVFLLILRNWKTQRWPRVSLIALPPLTALWANLHGGFIAGLVLIFFYLLGEAAEHFLWKSDKQNPPPQAGDLKSSTAWLGGTLAVCLLGSLCTPYHYHLYELPFRVMSSPALVKTIAEMRSPLDPAIAGHYLSFFIMALLIAATLIRSHLAGARRLPAADLLILLFFGYQAMRHIRHLPLFAVTAAPILGWTVGHMLEGQGEALKRRVSWLAATAALLAAAFLTLLRDFPESYWNRNVLLASGVTYIEINYPRDVCDFILANQFEGRMFNPVNCSGYLIWRLSPESHKVFTDGRFDIFGDRFVWDEFAVSVGMERDGWDKFPWERVGLTESQGRHVRDRCGGAGWSEILDRWKINFVIAEHSWRGRSKMRASSLWESVFYWEKPFDPEKSGYEIFVRRIEQNLELISRCRWSFRQTQKRGGLLPGEPR